MLTVELKPVPVLKEVSFVPSLFNLIILFSATLLKLLNVPPIIIFPSVWTTIVLICEVEYPKPVPTLNEVSFDPSLFNLIILFSVIPLKFVNEPPTIIFPSACSAVAETALPKPGLFPKICVASPMFCEVATCGTGKTPSSSTNQVVTKFGEATSLVE